MSCVLPKENVAVSRGIVCAAGGHLNRDFVPAVHTPEGRSWFQAALMPMQGDVQRPV